MKKLSIAFILTIIASAGFAQVGIYKSVEDYKKENLVTYDTYGGTYHLLGNFKVFFTKNGEPTQRLDVNHDFMWGYKRADGDILRVDRRHNPCVIIETGEIMIYGNHESHGADLNLSLNTLTFVPQISWGPEGKMKLLTKTNMVNMMGSTEKIRNEIYALENSYEALIQYIVDYNNQVKKI